VNKFADEDFVSEMDKAIAEFTEFCEAENLYNPATTTGSASSLNWVCCVFVYTAMRYAVRMDPIEINQVVWNSINSGIINRMGEGLDENWSRGDRERADEDNINVLAVIDTYVEQIVSSGEPNLQRNLVLHLANLLGAGFDKFTTLSHAFKAYHARASETIVPELKEIFS
jgi:hypothetical protein